MRLRQTETPPALKNSGVNNEDLADWWKHSSLAEKFECGLCSPEKFAEGVIDHFRLDSGPEELLAAFQNYVAAPYPGARRLLTMMRRHGRTACLSNTNQSHWQVIEEQMEILDCFDRLFPSHWIHCRKPSTRAFQTVLEELPAEPENVIFFDDLQENIDAARGLGIRSARVQGIDELKAAFESL